jgi:hypothetical protein
VTARSGSRRPTELHPAVQAALPPSAARDADDPVQPHNCGEPQALSNHINDWERRNPGRSCRPGDPEWRNNLSSALGEINPEGGISSAQGTTPRAACANCSQTVPRLYTLAGRDPPPGVLAPGHQRPGGAGPQTRTTPPPPDFHSPENRATAPHPISAQGGPPEPRSLGTWTYDESRNFWHRH